MTLDGRGPLTFALASGAGGNVIFTGAAQRIGLTGGRKVNVTGASGDVKARLAHVDKLVAGPLHPTRRSSATPCRSRFATTCRTSRRR